MEMPDYSEYDGLGLAELVAKRAVTPLELTEAAIERIERHNPTLNAVVYKGYDDARARAKGDLPDGPFKGVPFLIKDLGMPVAGWPRSFGSSSPAKASSTPRTAGLDQPLSRRRRRIGDRQDQYPRIWHHRHDRERRAGPPAEIPGDPEPHSRRLVRRHLASAVAAGVVPLAHAADGLGSIHIPCRLLLAWWNPEGHPRPRAQPYRTASTMRSAIIVDHVVTRTVRDSAAMLDATGYAEPGSLYPAPPKERPYLEEITRSPGKLRIAWSSETPSARPIDPETRPRWNGPPRS